MKRGVAFRCVCGKKMDMHYCTTDANAVPDNGDILVCGHCGTTLEIIDSRQGIAKALNHQEFDQLSPEMKKAIIESQRLKTQSRN